MDGSERALSTDDDCLPKERSDRLTQRLAALGERERSGPVSMSNDLWRGKAGERGVRRCSVRRATSREQRRTTEELVRKAFQTGPLPRACRRQRVGVGRWPAWAAEGRAWR